MKFFPRPVLLPLALLIFMVMAAFITHNLFSWSEKTPVAVVLQDLGDTLKVERPDNLEDAWVKRGEALIKKGKARNPDGKMGTYISKHYNCNNCHNTVQEDPDLSDPVPGARLSYARENDIPFLQGTTFKGVVNRERWYNGDYEKKYGALVEKARNDIKEAIQLCATECSQGRELKDWEMKAVLAYLWSLEYTLEDIGFSSPEIDSINDLAKQEAKHPSLIATIKDKYFLASPATFARPPENKEKGYELTGDPEKGEAIYELSCQQCHFPNGISEFVMDKSTLTMNKLLRNLDKSDEKSIYHAIREGTAPVPGHRPYMPQYTLERMSNQQVADLRAYISSESSIP